jgi:hypothetical protein
MAPWLLLAAVLPALVAAAPASEGRRLAWWEGTLSPAIPDSRQVLGHDFGERISDPEQILRYVEALHAAAPDQTRLIEYARSWEGRPLHYLAIGEPATIARLDEIKAGMRRLADPRTLTAADRADLLDSLPVIVWLAHGVHGNEVTPSDAALATAYHLLAGAGTPEIDALLAGTLVVIDPLQNPDGRARFVQHYRSLAGLEPQPSPIAAERVERWPSGRTNHYLFDMNRDWFALTQPEVQGRVKAFLEFFPTVYVDLHEMGTDQSYYFPPPAVPHNPHLGPGQMAGFEIIGQQIAARFDALGFRYFTRENYDAFYPGYGDTWPTLQGAIGMTFEMASPRGLAGRDRRGHVVTYFDGVARHFAASLATIGAAATHRRALLEAFVEHRGAASGRRGFVLARQDDPGRVDRLAALLARQGVEVRHAPDGARLCGASVPVGSYLVATAQPAGQLATTLLADESPAEPAFWVEQERRAERREPQDVYDVVAWSLPQLFDVPVSSCEADFADFPIAQRFGAPPAAPGTAEVAYLVPWGTRSGAQFLAAALRAGLRVDFATRPFRQGELRFGTGSLIVPVAANEAGLHARVVRLAAETGAEVRPTSGSWVDEGIDFGSRHVRTLLAPRIAIAWGEPGDVLSAGALRYAIEQKLGYPVAPVWTRDLGSDELDAFDVVVLPDGTEYAALAEAAGAQLAAWVRRGGTLVGIGGALELLGESGVGLLATAPELRSPAAAEGALGAGFAHGARAEQAEEGAGGPRAGAVFESDADYRAAIEPVSEYPLESHGVLANAVADPEHWLAAGLSARVRFMYQGDRVYAPLRLDQGTNVLTWAAEDSLVAGGYLAAATRRQLARKPAVMAQSQGRGLVIGFAADPAFRGMLDGADVLLANALFFGPAQASPVPAQPWPQRRD